MSSSVRDKSRVRLIYLLTLFPLWKILEAIKWNNTANIVIYTIVLVLYVGIIVYLLKSTRPLMRYRKSKTADNLYNELKQDSQDTIKLQNQFTDSEIEEKD